MIVGISTIVVSKEKEYISFISIKKTVYLYRLRPDGVKYLVVERVTLLCRLKYFRKYVIMIYRYQQNYVRTLQKTQYVAY